MDFGALMLGVARKWCLSQKPTCDYTKLWKTTELIFWLLFDMWSSNIAKKMWGLTAYATLCALSLQGWRRKSNLVLQKNKNTPPKQNNTKQKPFHCFTFIIFIGVKAGIWNINKSEFNFMFLFCSKTEMCPCIRPFLFKYPWEVALCQSEVKFYSFRL